MLIRVKTVKPLDNFELEVEFTNDIIKIMDMKPYLNLPIFKELNDATLFNKVKVVFNTVQWENGSDFDPDSLYSLSKELVKETIE